MRKFTESEFDKSFDVLFKTYSGRIYNYVLHLSDGDRYKAEEVTQITFMKLWQKRSELESLEALEPLMYTIAKNTFLNLLEHESIEYAYYNNILKGSKTYDNATEDVVDHNFLMEYIASIVSQMPPMRRLIYSKHRDEHLTYRQIAEELDISVNTVEIHISLALHTIRELLRQRYNIK